MLQGSATEAHEISAGDIRGDSGHWGKVLRAVSMVFQNFSFFCVVPRTNVLAGLAFCQHNGKASCWGHRNL